MNVGFLSGKCDMKRRHAFTLIELLVVVTIIVMLIAILLPSMKLARNAAQEAACTSNERQQVLAMLVYTGDNRGQFPEHHAPWPFYVRYWSSASVSWYTNIHAALRPNYIPNGKMTICPRRGANVLDSWMFNPAAYDGSYGGWDANTPIVGLTYAWYANYRPAHLSMAAGQRLFPARVTTATARDVLLTHLMMRVPAGYFGVHWYYDFTHGDHDALPTDPNAGFRGPTVPEIFGDGHAEIRHNADLQLRATANVVAAFQMWY